MAEPKDDVMTPEKIEKEDNSVDPGKVNEGEEITYEVIDDTPPEDQGRTPMKEPPEEVSEEELEKYSESVKKRIQHFTKGYHEERRAKEQALREKEEAIRVAQLLVEENKKLQTNRGETENALIKQATALVTGEVDEAKRRYKEAYEAGDADKLLAANEALTAAKIKADRVANYKPTPLQTQPTAVQPKPVQVDPKAKAWQESNPWFGSDKNMTRMALATHEELVEKGIDPTSDEYYDQINSRVKQLYPDRFPAEKQARRSVVAPATRSTAPRKIVLTQSQVNIAKKLGVPLELYAKQVAEQLRKDNG